MDSEYGTATASQPIQSLDKPSNFRTLQARRASAANLALGSASHRALFPSTFEKLEVGRPPVILGRGLNPQRRLCSGNESSVSIEEGGYRRWGGLANTRANFHVTPHSSLWVTSG
ncbi:hypothetical protein CORC01_08789 [Colletotrichum orchidophilum]|uniref:Uncharacterized protein n=1 Tax=Colletotrichum orchidophilum TaxID=1209926 RepID=A0A1G4B3G5_9PEZI|nr:uncharacterized protein CORC01_08789 [Colletotrichum orchidophilum]OHE95937.1 hypothetical protein CORC01_08789 [Colletotrichum orchidophilum]